MASMQYTRLAKRATLTSSEHAALLARHAELSKQWLACADSAQRAALASEIEAINRAVFGIPAPAHTHASTPA